MNPSYKLSVELTASILLISLSLQSCNYPQPTMLGAREQTEESIQESVNQVQINQSLVSQDTDPLLFEDDELLDADPLLFEDDELLDADPLLFDGPFFVDQGNEKTKELQIESQVDALDTTSKPSIHLTQIVSLSQVWQEQKSKDKTTTTKQLNKRHIVNNNQNCEGSIKRTRLQDKSESESESEKEQKPERPVKNLGIPNIDNSCYMNSVIQILVSFYRIPFINKDSALAKEATNIIDTITGQEQVSSAEIKRRAIKFFNILQTTTTGGIIWKHNVVLKKTRLNCL